MNKAWIGLGALVLVTMSCGGGGSGSTGFLATSTGTEQICNPGQPVPCACPGGKMGAQSCRDDGGGFEPCFGCGASSSSSSGDGGSSSGTSSGGQSATTGSATTT